MKYIFLTNPKGLTLKKLKTYYQIIFHSWYDKKIEIIKKQTAKTLKTVIQTQANHARGWRPSTHPKLKISYVPKLQIAASPHSFIANSKQSILWLSISLLNKTITEVTWPLSRPLRFKTTYIMFNSRKFLLERCHKDIASIKYQNEKCFNLRGK